MFNLYIPSQALFNLHRASALLLKCGSEDDQNFQSHPGHSRQPVRWRRYCMVSVWHSVLLSELKSRSEQAPRSEFHPHWVHEPRLSDVFWSICRLRSYRSSGFPFGTVPHRALTNRFTDLQICYTNIDVS